MMSDRKNIAIVGAGFGGLRTAILIGKKLKKLKLETAYRIVLIDQNDYHTYTPTLYEVATNDPDHTSYTDLRRIVTIPIQGLIENLPIRFLNSLVETIDLANGSLTCETEEVPYDYLVLAPGSEPNYFDIPGLEKFSTPLKTFRDSIEIREYILMAMQHKAEPIQVVVGGGGSAGVELAGEIRSWLNKIQKESRGNRRSQVSIIETAPTVLAPFPTRVIEKATERLAQIGVRTMINERIASVHDKIIALSSGKTVPFDVFIWTGGVKPSSLMSPLPLAKDVKGRVIVTERLECLPADHPAFNRRVYGLGDAVTIINKKTNTPVPGTAHAALLQAPVVANNLTEEIRLIEGLDAPPHFRQYRPKDYPYIIPIGGKYAIARFGKLIVGGMGGWFLKGLVELSYFCSLMPISRAVFLWLAGLRIIIRNDKIKMR